jgi:hypothetical protein
MKDNFNERYKSVNFGEELIKVILFSFENFSSVRMCIAVMGTHSFNRYIVTVTVA